MTKDQFEVPPHIPSRLVYDVDFYNLNLGDGDVQQAWKQIQDNAPDIFWTPRNGGHWIATRATEIKEIELDHTHFSHQKFTIPWVDPPAPNLPLCLDPPEHEPIRRLINPALAPRSVMALGEKAQQVAVELIEDIAPRGECEFVAEFSSVLPIVVFLSMVDLPESDREMLISWANAGLRSELVEVKIESQTNIMNYLGRWIEERTRNPGDDLISKIIHARVEGEPLQPNQILGLCSLILVGGLDTVAGMLGFIARFLAMHPEHREQLIAMPEIPDHVIEELMRRHGLPNTSRFITQDYEFRGVQLKKGESIQIPTCLYGLDDRIVDDPLTVNFNRPPPIPHATFGNGPHRCPGAMLAKREIKVFLEQWLKRIPDFRIKPGTKPLMAGGVVNGILELHLEWDV